MRIVFAASLIALIGCASDPALRYAAAAADCRESLTRLKSQTDSISTYEGCSITVECHPGGSSGPVCSESPASLADRTERARASVAVMASAKTHGECSPDRIIAIRLEAGRWSASGCDRSFLCKVGRASAESCDETVASKEIEVAKDRLVVETQCAKAQIRVTDESKWRNASEVAYRLRACGADYVCSVATNHTECRTALSQQPQESRAPGL